MTTLVDEVTVRCTFEGGCGWTFEGEREEAVESAVWHREQVHGVPAPASGRLPLSGGYGFEVETKEGAVQGLDALERMDRGESQEPLGEGEPRGDERLPTAPSAGHSAAASDVALSASSPSPNGSTRESLIAEIRAYAAQHGEPPKSDRSPGSRLYAHARKLDLVYADLVEEATGMRPRSGRRKRARPLGAAEPARATGATAARPDAAPSGSTEGGGQTEGSRSASGSSRSQGDARVGAAARSPGGASQKKPKTTAVAKVETAKPAETPDLRDPIRTADIPYDADRLEDEAAFLRRRADAMNELAAALRKFEEISSSD